MIPSYSSGPLGMQDMVMMAKDVGKGPLAGIKYKKQGGEVVDEVEVKFHGPKNKPEQEIAMPDYQPYYAYNPRYDNKYLNYKGLNPSLPGTMGTDSQPGGGGCGGGAPGTLGSESYTAPCLLYTSPSPRD